MSKIDFEHLVACLRWAYEKWHHTGDVMYLWCWNAAELLESQKARIDELEHERQGCLQTKEDNRWVPVDERLPEIYEEVITLRNTGEYCLECHIGDEGWAFGEYEEEPVTHWMPLPELPIPEMAGNAILDHAPAAVVSAITSAEKQAIFRLGQMDMRDSMAAMLRDVANRSRGTIRADFMAAADLIAEREIP